MSMRRIATLVETSVVRSFRRPTSSALTTRNPYLRTVATFSRSVASSPATADDNHEHGKGWWRDPKWAIGTAIGVVTISVGYYQFDRNQRVQERLAYEKTEAYQHEVALKKLESVAFTKPMDSYIHRERAERQIEDYLSHIELGQMVAVTSPRGVGKTTMLKKLLYGKEGVLVVRVIYEAGFNADTPFKLIALAMDADVAHVKKPVDFVIDVCRSYHAKHKKYPIIVLDIKKPVKKEQLLDFVKPLRECQKTLSCDERVAFTIADISATVISFGYTGDSRTIFVPVPDFDKSQALQLLKPSHENLLKIGVNPADIIARIGGKPDQLEFIAKSTSLEIAEAKMTAIADVAEEEVERHVGVYPHHKNALVALTKREFGMGMKVKEYERMIRREKNNATLVDDVLHPSEEHDVIHYDLQSTLVRFHSFAHFMAAKKVLIT